MSDGSPAGSTTSTGRSRWRGVLTWSVNGPIVLAMLAVSSRTLTYLEAYVGWLAARAVAAAVIVALVLRRPVPGLGAVRRIAARFPSFPAFSLRGLELWWVVTAATYGIFVLQMFPPAYLPGRGEEVLRTEDLAVGWPSQRLGWLVDRNTLLALHGNDAEATAFTTVDLASEPPVAELHPAPWREILGLTLVPPHAVAFAHDGDGARNFSIDLDSKAAVEISRPGVVASAYDAASDRLCVIERPAHGLLGQTAESLRCLPAAGYLSGDLSVSRSYSLAPLAVAEALVFEPGPTGRILAWGGGSERPLVEIDLAAGSARVLDTPPGHGSVAVDGSRRRAYLTNWIRGTLAVIDLDRFAVEREAFLGGAPGSIAVLPSIGGIAVGTYLSGNLMILDADTLELRARLKTRWRGRDVVWDDAHRTLFFADSWGVHRVRFPADWRATR